MAPPCPPMSSGSDINGLGVTKLTQTQAAVGHLDRIGARPFARRGSSTHGQEEGYNLMPSKVSGIDYIRDPKLFKGMAFTLEERQTLGIHGLLPPRIKTQEEMAEHSMRNLRRFEDPLNKYMYMADLLERNEKLFYKVLSENTAELMPIVYTPTVGLACQRFGLAFKRPKVRCKNFVEKFYFFVLRVCSLPFMIRVMCMKCSKTGLSRMLGVLS